MRAKKNKHFFVEDDVSARELVKKEGGFVSKEYMRGYLGYNDGKKVGFNFVSKEYMMGYNLGYNDGKKVGLLEAYRDELLGLEKICDKYFGIRSNVLKEIVFEKDRIERKAKELGGGKE